MLYETEIYERWSCRPVRKTLPFRSRARCITRMVNITLRFILSTYSETPQNEISFSLSLSVSFFVTDIKSEYSFPRSIIYLIEISRIQRECRHGHINYTTNGENLCIQDLQKTAESIVAII